jgi:hypothetical protein
MNMKNIFQQPKTNRTAKRSIASVCQGSCRKLAAQIAKTKDAILNEFRDTLEAHEQLLRLALNEAEALAWETAYPHLVFPLLATEKAQAVAAWRGRQRSVQQTRSKSVLAA